MSELRAMKKIPDYSGKSDVERWIDRFELAVEMDEVFNKEAELLSARLTGPAYVLLKTLSEEEQKDAEAIKKALRDKFANQPHK